MGKINTMLAAGAAVGALASGAWALSASSASADVVCNRWHECWHVHDRYTDYPANLGIVFHADNWHGRHYHWRSDRFDHGYYRNGVWIAF